MALPTTNLSFSALQTEYGNSNPISLSEYYRGGINVPSGQTSTYGTIPTSGQISLGIFRGTTKLSDVISLNDQYIVATFAGASQASAVYGLSSDGYVYQGTYTTTQSFSQVEAWITPTTSAVNYEVYVTVTSGSLDFGTTGSWVSLSSGTSYWRRTVGSNQFASTTLNVQIRKQGTVTVLDTATITLEADTTTG